MAIHRVESLLYDERTHVLPRQLLHGILYPYTKGNDRLLSVVYVFYKVLFIHYEKMLPRDTLPRESDLVST